MDDQRTSPYQGLDPYTERDQGLFVGREGDTEFIAATVRTRRLTLIYGESGVGKTSLLQAGVAPQLAGEPNSVAVVFRDWLANDCDTALQSAVASALRAKSLPVPDAPDFVEFVSAAAKSADLFLIFDQFEDYFFTRGKRGWLEGPLARMVRSEDLAVNVVLSVRSDALYLLDPLQDRIPNLFTNSIQLEPLTEEDARRVIVEPLERYKKDYAARAGQKLADPPIEPDLPDLIIRGVSRSPSLSHSELESGAAPGRIETAFLQIVLTRLWQEEVRSSRVTAVANALRKSFLSDRIDAILPGGIKLRKTTLEEKLKGVPNIAFDYVKAGVASAADAISKAKGKALQNDVRALCERLFKRLVASSGRSVPYTEEELRAEVRPELAGLVPDLLDQLQRNRVLKPVSSGAGPPMFQMMHDVLGAAVLRWLAEYQLQFEVRGEIQQTKQTAQTYTKRFRIALGGLVLVLLGVLFFGQRLANRAAVRQRDQALAQAQRQIADQARQIAARDHQVSELNQELAVIQRLATPPPPLSSPSPRTEPQAPARSTSMLKSIDVLIGLTLVMLVVSMAVTVITHAVTGFIESRGRHLRDGIAELLLKIDPGLGPDLSGQIAQAVLMHPLIRGPRGLGTVIHREELIGILLELAGGGVTPLELGSANTERLRNALQINGIADTQRALRNIRIAALEIEKNAPQLASHIRLELAILETSSSEFVAKVHAWFDSTMDRVSERFTYSTRIITFAVAVLIAVLLELDSVGLVNRLAMNDALREALLVQAQSIATKQIGPNAPQDAELEYSRALEQTGLVAPPHSPRQWAANWRNVNPLGVCISALLLSLGASFWYDTLKRLLNLRSVLAAEDDEQRRGRQKGTAIPKEALRSAFPAARSGD